MAAELAADEAGAPDEAGVAIGAAEVAAEAGVGVAGAMLVAVEVVGFITAVDEVVVLAGGVLSASFFLPQAVAIDAIAIAKMIFFMVSILRRPT